MNLRDSFVAIVIGLSLGWWWFRHQETQPTPAAVEIEAKEVKPKEVIRTGEAQKPQKIEVSKVIEPAPKPKAANEETLVLRPPPPPGQIEFEIKEGIAVTQGDIVLGKPTANTEISKGIAQANKTSLWPSARIPYSIQGDVTQKSAIAEAIDYFQQNTAIRFEPYSGQKDSIVFVAAQQLCASYLGRVGGAQPIYLSANCGTHEIMHELMHALGFVHEHARPDRDQFLEVLWQNIPPEFHLQFWMMPDTVVHEYTGSVFRFDPESIMLYEGSAFAKAPGLITLRPRGNFTLEPSRGALSRTDKERIFYLYGQ